MLHTVSPFLYGTPYPDTVFQIVLPLVPVTFNERSRAAGCSVALNQIGKSVESGKVKSLNEKIDII